MTAVAAVVDRGRGSCGKAMVVLSRSYNEL